MCGVIGVIGPSQEKAGAAWAAYEAYRGLLTLQHRGQDAAGILSYDSHYKKFHSEKELGLIANVFNKDNLESLHGNMAIGHTRYATNGADGKKDLQPLVTGYPIGVGMAHNGNLVNYHRLASEVNRDFGHQLLTGNDLEIFLSFWCQAMGAGAHGTKSQFTFEKAIDAAKTIFERAQGAYGLVGLIAGEGMVGMRDPDGIRPLVLGKKEEPTSGKTIYCLSSETIALNFLGYEFVRDITPGELIFIGLDGQVKTWNYEQAPVKKSPCMFEWIYFSGAESTLEGRSVYRRRLALGQVLGKKVAGLISNGSIKPDIVCPVPDTSRTASIALAESLKLPYREALIKNRYIHRSFILNTQEARERAVELKLSPVLSEIQGKNIFLVDDSVVRGTTSKKIVDLLKRNGAASVTLGITCPPLRNACYYGIDFPSPEELIACNRDVDQIAQWIGVDQVVYLDEEDVKEALELDHLCMACVNGKYSTNVEDGIEFAKRRRTR